MSGIAEMRVAVLGTGNMGEAIVRGLVRVADRARYRIVACDKIEGKLTALRASLPGVATEGNSATAARGADVVVLAVKPNDVEETLKAIRPEIERKNILLLSVAAGVRVASLRTWGGENCRIVRCMPNLPATIGKGVTAVYADSDADWEQGREILSVIGQAVRLSSEAQLDVATALSAGGPAFVSFVLEAMIEGGIKCGLSSEVAEDLALAMFSGTAEYLQKTGLKPAVVRERVSSPGGTTLAGLGVMEKAGMKDTLISAIEAAARRAAELGGEKKRTES